MSPASESIDGIVSGSRWATTIGTICDSHGGDIQTGPFGSQLHASDYADEGTPVVMPRDMQNGTIVCDRIARIPQQHVERLRQHVLLDGDIVYSRRGDVTRFAVVTMREQGWLCGTGSIRIRLNCSDLEIGYIRQYLRQEAVGAWLQHNAKGVTMANLNTGIVRALPFVYPPLLEQRRIAEVLDRAETLRTKRRAALAQLDTLTQSIFLDLFGDPVSNHNGWPRVPFSNLLTSIESGWSPICLDRPAIVGEWGVLKLGAVTWCEFDSRENKALPEGVHPEPALEVKAGDLLFVRKNTYELVGACALVKATPPKLMMPDLIFRFQLQPDAPVERRFLQQLLTYPTKRREVQRLASGTSGSMPNISKSRLLGSLIELPPLGLQQDFARRIAAVETLKSTMRASLAELDALFASLQHRAFRGEL